MDIREFLENGYLQEVNRLFFHPLGLALEVSVEPIEGGGARLSGIWDFRDCPEGVYFGDLSSEDQKQKMKIVKKQRLRLAKTRKKLLGYEIQPIG